MPIRSEESFQLFWEKALSNAQTLINVSDPQLPHKRKIPKRFETGSAEAEFPTSSCSYYGKIYYEGLDLIINCIKNRLEQEDNLVYQRLQDVLLKAVRHEDMEQILTLK